VGGSLNLAPALENNLRNIMPDAGLRQYEWKKHGRCSGLPAQDYFALLSHAFTQLKIPPLLQPKGRDTVVERQAVLSAFHRLNPGFPERGVVLRCQGRERPPLLSELRVCLTPSGQPAECTASFKPNCPIAVRIRAR
jgi:ribonuclease T2